jgi:Mn2+/Fe2+ NRAMP family transporter
MSTSSQSPAAPPIPGTFREYIASFGPGIVIVLTWLGAGDIVDSAVAGGHYGYALMWAMALSLLIRFAFVNIIAKYQLCNERGESVMAGLKRIHAGVPIVFGLAALVLSHCYGSYMIRGLGEVTQKLAGGGVPAWAWSIFWVTVSAVLVFRGGFQRIEKVFFLLLGMLSAAFIGIAAWNRPDPLGILRGLFLLQVPEQSGAFHPLLVVTSLIGAVAGSISNLLYPYFIVQKGWRAPSYLRVQRYDLLFGILILILLDLSVWVVGAEVLHPRGVTIRSLDDLAQLLVLVMGRLGAPVFYLGVFAALFMSTTGSAMGYGYLAEDIVATVRGTSAPPASGRGRVFTYVALWVLISPLVWSLPSMPGFITLTVVVNAASVVVMPLLSAALWWITARSAHIGSRYRNRWWENLIMACLFVLTLYGTWQTGVSLLGSGSIR